MNKTNKPILITGVHRSGTTWLANMLHFSGETSMIEEPFNIEPWAYSLNGLAKYWYTYTPELDHKKALQAYDRIVKMKAGKLFPKKSFLRWIPFLRSGRPLIKDPLSSLSVEWINNHFDLQTVVLVRHPAAFINSLKRKDWSFPFDHLLEQNNLIEDYLPDLDDDLKKIDEDNLLESGALCWKCINRVLYEYSKKFPSIILVRHEDLALNPIKEFGSLYNKLGLTWSNQVEVKIKKFTGDDNPISAPGQKTHHLKRDSKNLINKWKDEMPEEEVEKILKIVSPIDSLFNYED